MSRFSDILQSIDSWLDLPQPARSRIVLEIAADLEDTYRHYLAQGLTAAEAHRRAVARCDLSDDSLRQLVQVHANAWRRFLDHCGDQARSRLERAAFILVLSFILYFTVPLVLSSEFVQQASLFVGPILAMTIVALILALLKFNQLFIRQDHDPRRLRRRLPVILYLAGANLLMGFYGHWLELYRTAGWIERDLQRTRVHLIDWATRSSALLIVCFLAVIFCGLLWFVLNDKAARIEQAEATHLLKH